VSIWHQPRGEAAKLVAGRIVEEVWGNETYPVLADTFVQVNKGAGALLTDHVVRASGQGDRAVDAYCGLGGYGRELARGGWMVTGIELSEGACAAAAHEAPSGFSVVRGRVEEELAELLPADLLIVNPPRSGLDASVSDVILASPPSRLVYVSCDPATLARDLGLLKNTYRIQDLHCFDLFPQTAHVETVAVLGASA
jgi:tRNA/tmRNA/rRNA uracil-C5-methylase (TrmA/RlmC/RlmD family)